MDSTQIMNVAENASNAMQSISVVITSLAALISTFYAVIQRSKKKSAEYSLQKIEERKSKR